MGELIRRRGGEAIVAPAMRETGSGDDGALREYVDQLRAKSFDAVIFLTGVGLRQLLQSISEWCSIAEFTELIRSVRRIARGPKPVAVLRELGLGVDLVAPEPNTWRELLAAIDAAGSIRGSRIAVQEYGVSNPELLDALRERGADVRTVSIYRWALPEDIGPLRAAVDILAQGQVDAAIFTSATQVHHLFEIAGDRADELRRAASKVLIASIGPICTEALAQHGLPAGLEASHPKMGRLVGEVIDRIRPDRPLP